MHSKKIFGSKFAAEVTFSVAPDGVFADDSKQQSVDNRHVIAPQRWPGIVGLLRPHSRLLALGLFAVVGEGAANLLEPWPLKLVFDSFGRSGSGHGWLNRWVQATVGTDKIAILKFAAVAVLAIALLDAVCFFAEKYLTTSVGPVGHA